jgi:hypothetical protein
VLKFLEKFQQNALFTNVNLDFPRMDTRLLPTLDHVLPLIVNNNDGNINSIQLWHIGRLENIYMSNYELAKNMLKMTRILVIR